MQKIFLVLLLLLGRVARTQTLISEMGPVRFYNSLDSASSSKIIKIAQACYCLMQLDDSSHALLFKLDIRPPSSTDTAFYTLGFNNLEGNYITPPDSTSGITELPSIYIKARDSVVNVDTILRLLDYGIHHYTELKNHQQFQIGQLLKQKIPARLKRMISVCKV